MFASTDFGDVKVPTDIRFTMGVLVVYNESSCWQKVKQINQKRTRFLGLRSLSLCTRRDDESRERVWKHVAPGMNHKVSHETRVT